MNDNWKLLDWSYVCDQSPGVTNTHNRASDSAEYGINFFEFINTTDGLEKFIQEWWDSLSSENQKQLLVDELNKVRNHAHSLEIALAKGNLK